MLIRLLLQLYKVVPLCLDLESKINTLIIMFQPFERVSVKEEIQTIKTFYFSLIKSVSDFLSPISEK